MKLFRVVFEKDGKTIKELGKTSAEIIRTEIFFVADTMDEVWQGIEFIRNDPEKTLIAVIEDQPAVFIIEKGK
jgi:hypothetical protein